MPHFHFLLGKNARAGKDFMYLKQALEKEAKDYKIKFNFMEPRQYTGLSKKQARQIERLSWMMHQGNTNKIQHYLSQPEMLSRTIDLMRKHYENTQNLSYFIKTLLIINQRLQELKLSIQYKGIDLQENIFFFLTETQKHKLKQLENGRDIELNLNSVLDREILKYTYGYKSDVMNVMIEKFKIHNIKKSQLYVPTQKTRKIFSEKENSFKDLVIRDIRNALSDANSEKGWKNLLKELGYIKASIKSAKNNGKREKIGLSVETSRKTKLYISFHEMRLARQQIIKILMHNKKKKKAPKKRKSLLEGHKTKRKKSDEVFFAYKHRMNILLKLYNEGKSTLDESYYEYLQTLAKKYQVSPSKMYQITTFENSNTTIVDSNQKIELKRSSAKDSQLVISDMLDIATVKGWNLTTLKVTGNEKFVQEAKRQIHHRTTTSHQHIPTQGGIKKKL